MNTWIRSFFDHAHFSPQNAIAVLDLFKWKKKHHTIRLPIVAVQAFLGFPSVEGPVRRHVCLRVTASIAGAAFLAGAAFVTPLFRLRAPALIAPFEGTSRRWSVRRTTQAKRNQVPKCEDMLKVQACLAPPIVEVIFFWQLPSIGKLPTLFLVVPWNGSPYSLSVGWTRRPPLFGLHPMLRGKLFFPCESFWVIPVVPLTISFRSVFRWT